MLHPVIATELVRQRQATLDAEARHQRLVRQALSRAGADPDSGGFVLTARTFVRHFRAQVTRAT
jgi:hypothetical protein